LHEKYKPIINGIKNNSLENADLTSAG